ncbi:MAG: WbqC family protein, partial [Verrucomicrobiota bacterium]
SAQLAAICQSLGATEYLSGSGGLNYMNQDDFDRIGCQVLVQKWTDFEYAQQYPLLAFVPRLTTLDLLLNCPDSALEMIQSAGAWLPHRGCESLAPPM